MLEIIITSSLLILIVLALRFLLRGKLSPTVIYAMWAIVAVRLLVPVSIAETSISVMNLFERTETVRQDYADETVYSGTTEDTQQFDVDNLPQQTTGQQIIPPADSPDVAEQRDSVSASDILLAVWLTGAAAVLAYTVISNVRFYLYLKRSRTPAFKTDCSLPLYIVEGIDSPCMFGIIRPAIYLNEFAAEDTQRAKYIITHELTHYRHLDHIWAVVRVLCIALHWFNPLVWLAAHISKQDCELACDSAAIRTLGDEHRYDYGRTLIDMINTKFRLSTAVMTSTAMTSDEKSIKKRIQMIRITPQTVLWAAASLCVALVLAFVITFTGGETKPQVVYDDNTSATDADSINEESVLPWFVDETNSVTAMIYGIYGEYSKVPSTVYTLDSKELYSDIIDILKYSDSTEIQLVDIPINTRQMYCISVNNFEYFHISTDGYVIWKYLGEKANYAKQICVDTKHESFPVSSEYPADYHGFYKMSDNDLYRLIEAISAVQAVLFGNSQEMSAVKIQDNISRLIKSGTCIMSASSKNLEAGAIYETVLDTNEKMEQALLGLAVYQIHSLEMFDPTDLPEDISISEVYTFSAPSSAKYYGEIMLYIADSEVWMEYSYDRTVVGMKIIRTASLDYFLHDLFIEWIRNTPTEDLSEDYPKLLSNMTAEEIWNMPELAYLLEDVPVFEKGRFAKGYHFLPGVVCTVSDEFVHPGYTSSLDMLVLRFGGIAPVMIDNYRETIKNAGFTYGPDDGCSYYNAPANGIGIYLEPHGVTELQLTVFVQGDNCIGNDPVPKG